jgi:hypothetical protein
VNRTAAAAAVSGADSRREVAADRRAPPVSASARRLGTDSGAAVSWTGPAISASAESMPPGLTLFSYFFFIFIFLLFLFSFISFAHFKQINSDQFLNYFNN